MTCVGASPAPQHAVRASPLSSRRGIVLVGRRGHLRNEALDHFEVKGTLVTQVSDSDDLAKAFSGDSHGLLGNAVVIVTEPFLPGPLTVLRHHRRARSLTRRYSSLAAAARDQGADQLVVCSTTFLYGDDDGHPLTTVSPVQPRAETVAAWAAEQAAGLFTSLGGRSVVLRFGWVFGLHDPITAQVLSAARNGWRLIDGDPGAWVASLNVAQAATAIDAAIGAPPGTYNVSDSRTVAQAAVNAVLQDVTGAVLHPLYDPYWGPNSTLFGASRRLAEGDFARSTGWLPAGPDLLGHLGRR